MEDRVAVMISVYYSDPAQWEGNAFLASERFVLFSLQFRPVLLLLWYFYVLLCQILVLKILFCAVRNSFLVVKFIMRNDRVLPFFIFIYL